MNIPGSCEQHEEADVGWDDMTQPKTLPVPVIRAPSLLVDAIILAPAAYLALRVGLGGSASEANTTLVGAAVAFDSGEHHLLLNLATSCLLFRALAVLFVAWVTHPTRSRDSDVAVVLALGGALCCVPNFFAHSLRLMQVALILSATGAAAADRRLGILASVRRIGAAGLFIWAVIHWVQLRHAAAPPLALGACALSFVLLVLGSPLASTFAVQLEHSSWVPPLAALRDGTVASVSVNNDLIGVLGHMGCMLPTLEPSLSDPKLNPTIRRP